MHSCEAAAEAIRDQVRRRARELDCLTGSGNLDLPGSSNWYVPDIAVVPTAAAKGAGALLPDQTLLIVEVTSETDAETDRVVKRKRYAEYGAPLHLLVDRQERSVTLYSEPGRLGYTRADGPHPYGTKVRLPAPFDLDLDTSALEP
ncbi:Uma2 family endonuclease [Streptomyces sp. SP18CS02]|uniref:Uma2 family endonuclease n=1 Tax=Streptomyces sp. SP18CS02 TaxID=3002531 RepID=UPI002E7872F3|nr:Uma2 family endonuclease [Streptomyces sp. SP18CS02]MEE1751843.1 Uma2 family endonuclease [Streptomyces sp. SP18CS02]